MINQSILKKSGYIKYLAPAKLNLFLKIISKRSDGYHNLQSIFQNIDLYDEIYIRLREDGKINIDNTVVLGPKELDLGYKAAKILLEGTEFGVDIIINKKIPIGSGLGGGSSNAATILMVLNSICSLNFKKNKLMELGLKLGADVPFFIFGNNAWVEGVGDKLKPISIPEATFFICIPDLSISTQSIFNSFELTKASIPLKIPTYFDAESYNLATNDLERTVIKKHREIADLLLWLKNFGFARMSGSGSSVFIKVKDDAEARLIDNDKGKPKNIKSFIVKGLSAHPFNYC
tara:strand:- start:670 stop:1539 length:870 start_codon:yes stop_codon:yes gene_type:complete